MDGQPDYLPIATLKDGADGYIELRWDRRAYEDGGKRFYLTDGAARIDLNLSAAQTWRRFDTLHFAIVGLAGSVALYCWAPENSEKHGAAILSGQGDMSLTPVELVLGANHDASVVGTGLYSRIGAWDAAASEEDIATLFAGGVILTSVEQLAADQAAVAAAAGQFRGTILGVAGTQRKHIGPG